MFVVGGVMTLLEYNKELNLLHLLQIMLLGYKILLYHLLL